MANELALAKKKLTAVLRAERSLAVRLETIDWESNVLKPQLEELENSAASGKLAEFMVKVTK